MWGIKLKGFIRQVGQSYSQGYHDYCEEGKKDNVKYKKDKDDMNDKDNNDDNIFFKSIRCYTFSEPQALAKVNDDGEYNKGGKGDKNVMDDNDDNKIFLSKNIKCHTFFVTTSSIRSE